MDLKLKTIKNWLGEGSINLFGIPFAGKDTQGAKLAETLNAKLVAGGEILRSAKDNQELQDILATGNLIPSDLYLEILIPYLSQDSLDNKPLILDSVGRKKGEEEIIVEATNKSDHPIKAVLLFEVDEDEVWARFEASQKDNNRGGRADDSKEVLENRLLKFKNQTLPVVEFYRNRKLVIDINGKQDREQVFNEMIDKLYSWANS